MKSHNKIVTGQGNSLASISLIAAVFSTYIYVKIAGQKKNDHSVQKSLVSTQLLPVTL